MRFARRGIFALSAVTLLAAAALAQQQQGQIVYEAPSQYQRITIYDTPDGYREMIFDAKWDGFDAIQTKMNKANQNELVLEYARYMIAPVALANKPKRILIVGLGGAALQKYLHETLPDTIIQTAELDPVVLTLAQKYFNFKEDTRQLVSIGDGRKFIEASKDKYDMIMLDAFSATSIPYMLSTKEFLESCKAHLAEGGILAANLWPAVPEYGSMLKTYDAVFPEWHVVNCGGWYNSILTAFPQKRGLTPESWMASAKDFEAAHKTNLDLANLIDKNFVPQQRIPESAKILLDKDEPKEQPKEK